MIHSASLIVVLAIGYISIVNGNINTIYPSDSDVKPEMITSKTPLTWPLLPDCDGLDWLACRNNMISSIFNVSVDAASNTAPLPTRAVPDYVIPNPEYCMKGFPGPGNGVGNINNNSWTNNMTTLIWTIESPFIKLNSTVFHTLNTSGSAPRNWPHDGPSMPGPSISPQKYGDTIVIYHNGHETHNCVSNYDGNVDYFNELGYDVMELFMPLFGCN